VGELGKSLIAALDPDAIVEAALAAASAAGITRSEDTLLPAEIAAARAQRVAAACAPFDKPELRDEIENARREREQIIDHINVDELIFSGYAEQAEEAGQGRDPALCRLHSAAQGRDRRAGASSTSSPTSAGR
jgi:type I restriction enzyme R subunit